MSYDPTIHVDYNADHSPMTFADTNGEPILAYRSGSTTNAKDKSGRPIPDGWVLQTNDGDEWIVGSLDITRVDEAVAGAKDYLVKHKHRLRGI